MIQILPSNFAIVDLVKWPFEGPKSVRLCPIFRWGTHLYSQLFPVARMRRRWAQHSSKLCWLNGFLSNLLGTYGYRVG